MGYTTDFEGHFDLDHPLTPEHKAYLEAFSDTRRMARDPWKAEELPDPVREAVGLPIGKDGEYFVGGQGSLGQDRDKSVLQYNEPPRTQPGLWCQWVPTEDGTGIVWNGSEKFYHYKEWIVYIIENFLKPWGYVLNGTVRWQGEESSDMGMIVVVNNVLQTKIGRVIYE